MHSLHREGWEEDDAVLMMRRIHTTKYAHTSTPERAVCKPAGTRVPPPTSPDGTRRMMPAGREGNREGERVRGGVKGER